MTAREVCIKRQCRSPLACSGWGYCRELNFNGGTMTDVERIHYLLDVINRIRRKAHACGEARPNLSPSMRSEIRNECDAAIAKLRDEGFQ